MDIERTGERGSRPFTIVIPRVCVWRKKEKKHGFNTHLKQIRQGPTYHPRHPPNVKTTVLEFVYRISAMHVVIQVLMVGEINTLALEILIDRRI
jgi:hypothetical protein